MVPPGPCTCGFSTSTIPPLSSVASPGAAVCPPNGARPPVKIGIDGRGAKPGGNVPAWAPCLHRLRRPKAGKAVLENLAPCPPLRIQAARRRRTFGPLPAIALQPGGDEQHFQQRKKEAVL